LIQTSSDYNSLQQIFTLFLSINQSNFNILFYTTLFYRQYKTYFDLSSLSSLFESFNYDYQAFLTAVEHSFLKFYQNEQILYLKESLIKITPIEIKIQNLFNFFLEEIFKNPIKTSILILLFLVYYFPFAFFSLPSYPIIKLFSFLTSQLHNTLLKFQDQSAQLIFLLLIQAQFYICQFTPFFKILLQNFITHFKKFDLLTIFSWLICFNSITSAQYGSFILFSKIELQLFTYIIEFCLIQDYSIYSVQKVSIQLAINLLIQQTSSSANFDFFSMEKFTFFNQIHHMIIYILVMI
jgi:hypothetical protein